MSTCWADLWRSLCLDSWGLFNFRSASPANFNTLESSSTLCEQLAEVITSREWSDELACNKKQKLLLIMKLSWAGKRTLAMQASGGGVGIIHCHERRWGGSRHPVDSLKNFQLPHVFNCIKHRWRRRNHKINFESNMESLVPLWLRVVPLIRAQGPTRDEIKWLLQWIMYLRVSLLDTCVCQRCSEFWWIYVWFVREESSILLGFFYLCSPGGGAACTVCNWIKSIFVRMWKITKHSPAHRFPTDLMLTAQ
jgi:hypothetical protein